MYVKSSESRQKIIGYWVVPTELSNGGADSDNEKEGRAEVLMRTHYTTDTYYYNGRHMEQTGGEIMLYRGRFALSPQLK